MAPGLLSALSAALSGPAVQIDEKAAEPASPSRVHLDAAVFPCLKQSYTSGSANVEGSGRLLEDVLASSLPLSRHNRLAEQSLGHEPRSLAAPDRNHLTYPVIGSLPAALSLAERASIAASTPLSSTLKALGLLPTDGLAAPTEEGQRLRRQALRGARLVFITAGYQGKRFIFEKAYELGVKSVIIDGPDSWSQELVEEGLVEAFIPLDMSDADTVFARCLAAINRLTIETGSVDGVLSFCEMAQPLVARLAERLGLPGNPPAAVDNARDKHATRRVLAAAGLPTPRNYLITSARDLTLAVATVGFPAVIKPICGAASIGVVRVNSEEHLQAAYANVIRDLQGAQVVAGALLQGSDAGGNSNAASWINIEVMMEEYLDGPEVDVDLVLWDGRPVYGAVNDNWETMEPYFNETGSNGPSTLPLAHQRQLCELAVASVQALGFTLGVFHVELKQTSRGARLIEVNCRMGGGVVCTMNKLVWGVDMAEEQLLCSAGIPSSPPVAQKPLMMVAEYLVNANKTGILRDLCILDKYRGAPGVIYAKAMVELGSKVVCKEDGLPTWVCQVLVTRPTLEGAIEFVKEIEEDVSKHMVIEAC